MKRIVSVALAIIMVMGLTACGGSNKKDDGKISIVTTIFPEYDWVKEVVGENNDSVEITMLLDNGVDLHSYQPTAEDIMKVTSCDVFIYVGGESDGWVEDALKESVNKDMKVINLMDALKGQVKEEEIVEGMQGEEEEAEEGEEEEGPEYDEHVWLSLKNTKILVQKISDTLGQVDTKHAENYQKNAENYIGKLEDLDVQYKDAVDQSEKKTVLFADRFPFRYLVDDYGISYYAAFVGCSAETEASFETVVFLAKKTDELNLGTVLTIEGSDQKIAKTVVENTKSKKQSIQSMNSMQGITSEDVKKGVTYLKVMEENLKVLEQALK
ncbi:MAG: metal ABC transporter substrate-binding protein [Eubacterium sp.]|nr:metal ABC transporter substrate-binding protein [Eubacterium sp.]